MTYEEIFEYANEIVDGLDVSGFKGRLVYQFTIVGEGAGKFYAEIDNGSIKLEPYDYNDCDAEFIASFDTLQKLLTKKIDPVFAYTVGKLKVRGSLDKALKLKSILNG